MDNYLYSRYLEGKEDEFEAVCINCGVCCGTEDDPCDNLRKNKDGKYFCINYLKRIGPQKTVSGKAFNCVSIKEHIRSRTLRPGCPYWKI